MAISAWGLKENSTGKSIICVYFLVVFVCLVPSFYRQIQVEDEELRELEV
jgi:hypothetical protein